MEKDKIVQQTQSCTIKNLFQDNSFIRIPKYQRAYSWEEKHCSQFLEDLLEQKGKAYYLGQILFEKQGNKLFIIDGQQRLTTTVIFFSVLSLFLEKESINITSIKELYLSDKFRTIEDDQILFKKCTRKHLVSKLDNTETLSQKRIIEAYKFFERELIKIDDVKKLEEIKNTLENATISTYFINSKIEATQVFEYQNNRGKQLSRFEVIKAYFMHQIYLNIEDNNEANEEINEIQGMISLIYRHLESIEGYFTENEILDNYCSLFLNSQSNIESLKVKFKAERNSKVEWIKNFFEYFAEFTASAKSIVNNKDIPEIANLFLVGNEANWKLVLLVLFYKGENEGKVFFGILKLLETLCFKLKLGDYRSDYLPNYAKRYFNDEDNYDIQDLLKNIRNATKTGFKWYWNNNNHFENIIPFYFENNNHHYDRKIIKFVLWQYENKLREEIKAGALMNKNQFNEYTIEHIHPQNPEKGKNTKAFEESFLHKAGNLALLTKSQNSKFNNKSFNNKKELFQDTALCSYKEIRANETWTKDSIENRHKNIVHFVKKYFDISHL